MELAKHFFIFSSSSDSDIAWFRLDRILVDSSLIMFFASLLCSAKDKKHVRVVWVEHTALASLSKNTFLLHRLCNFNAAYLHFNPNSTSEKFPRLPRYFQPLYAN
jgi:hypothetical protein